MSGETRILGSLIGAVLDSTADQMVSIDSAKYIITGYLVESFAGAKSQSFQVWTGPNRTGVKVHAQAFGTGIPAAADVANLLGVPQFGRVSTEATLYVSMSAPVQVSGLTGNIHVLGFDVP